MRRTMIGIVAAIALLVASPRLASAQEAVVSWDWEFWSAGVVPGVGSPLVIQNFTKATALCNMPPSVVPGGTVVNPSTLALDDPLIAGRDCLMNALTSSGTLQSLPLGNGMFATARARGATLISLRSAASNPFNRAVTVVAPLAPSGVLVLP